MDLQEATEIKDMLGTGYRCLVESARKGVSRGFTCEPIYLEEGARGEVKEVYINDHPEDKGCLILVEWGHRMSTFNGINDIRSVGFVPRRNPDHPQIPFY